MSLLDFLISPAVAQGAGGAAQPSPLMGLLFPILLLVAMFFLLIRPQMKRAKEHRELVSKLQKGDEIITSGGVAGRIDDIGEHFVSVEVADGVRVKLQRSAVTAVLPKGTLKSL
ncbi:MAG TPA: preprotein translocase subunit YajC [Arenimonas sp.]|nr:preprotein translocase subunit YajC [Arenimonas sp.]